MQRNLIIRYALTGSLVLLIFFLDILTPAGYNVSILYLAAMFLCVKWGDIRLFYGIALAASVLSLAGLLLSPSSGANDDLLIASANRLMTLLMLWVIVYIGVKRTKVLEERDQSREAARSLRDDLSHTLESLSIPFFSLDRQGKITFVNQNSHSFFGRQPNGLKGKIFWEELPQIKGSAVEEQFRKAVKENIHVHFEMKSLDGNRWFEVQAYPSKKGLSVFLSDITERNEIKTRLERQARALQTAQEPIFIWDENERVIYWNRAAAKLYGFPEREVLGKKIPDFLRTRYPIPFSEIQYQLKEKGVWEGEIVRYTLTEAALNVDCRMTALDEQDSRLVVEANRDITARKKSEERLRQQTNELLRSNQELERFAYAASHDLQEPLRKISSYAQLLDYKYAGEDDNQTRKYVASIVSSVTRLQKLIEGLLAFSRIGKEGKERGPVNLNHVLRDVLEDLEASVIEKNARISTDPLPTIIGNRAQLAQVFQNLIGNALKFSGKNQPQVHIRSMEGPDHWTLSVKDNGIGIDEKYHDKIFGVLERLHPRQVYPGSGLGLSIAKRIVEQHGGSLWVKSKSGLGSTFYFTLPKHGPEAPARLEPSEFLHEVH